jgi:hypothetical protein
MKIRFGRHLDGEHGWQPANQLNVTTTGPLGLLNLLETQLGLLQASPTAAERVVHYVKCLKHCDNPSRFYHRSFANDELGTAATLLAWRDQWHLQGWNKSLDAAASARLRDMQAVELVALKSLPPSIGERLQAVADILQKRKPPIAEITLCEPLAAYPQRWQTVLRLLPIREIATPRQDEAPASVLTQLQSALSAISRGEAPKKITWKDDGSVCFVRAETATLAARWLAETLRERESSQMLIVAEHGRSALDEVLTTAHLSRQGFKEPSAFRPALQVLPLMLEQLWSPLNIFGLLQFLTHPVCPLPSLARTRIAEKLARSPGIGASEGWYKMLAQIEEACIKNDRDWPKVRASIAFWVEHPRFERNAEPGAPIDAVLRRVTALADYFRARLASDKMEQRFAFNAGYSQVLACQQALEALLEQGTQHIRPRQLQKLVAQVTARGSSNQLLAPEIGACLSVSNPAAAIETYEHVVWWQMAAGAMPKPYPWSRKEQADLLAAGVELPALSDELNQLATDWLKPVFAAKGTFTVALPPPGQEVHPVWQMLETVFAVAPPVLNLEQYLERDAKFTQPVTCRPLPARQRWWQLPAGTPIPRKESDSFSSLESYLFNPYQWLLKYPAQLKPSGILDISDSFLLYGNLAHHLAERYYLRPDALSMNDAAFVPWFAENFADIVATEGVVLLMPGRGADLERFREQLRRAMLKLRSHLALAGVVKVEPEFALNGQFKGGAMTGSADLVVTRADGSLAIVDLKWAGGSKYPNKLAANSHLQLAIYAELLRQKTGQWPHLAYFILSQARLLVPDDRYFADAEVVRKNKGLEDQGTPQLWGRFQITWEWRKAMFDDGLFELILSDDEIKDALTEWPDDGLAPEALNQRYNDYLALAGWEAKQ